MYVYRIYRSYFSIILIKYCSKPILAVFSLSKTLYRQHPYFQVYTRRLEKESLSMHKDQIKAENEKNGNTNRKDTHTHTKKPDDS